MGRVSILFALGVVSAVAAQKLPAPPEPQRVPTPGESTSAPYAPRAILPGGVVLPLYEPGSPLLDPRRIAEPERYDMTAGQPGRIARIVNIHNPSIEFHSAPANANTGAVVILAAGGGHRTLNVGGGAADFVPFFSHYGVNTVILRNRLRSDGYQPWVDGVNDTLQAVRIVRAYSDEWKLDPHRIGVVGFSAGGELSSAAALFYRQFEAGDGATDKRLAGVSSRPDFVGLIYPGPTPLSPRFDPLPEIPDDVPPSFIATAGSGDRVHAEWANEYFTAMLHKGVPNIEMHIYGYGAHPGQPLSDGTRMGGGLTVRRELPMGTWQDRMIEWMRHLGFLAEPGVETRAAKDTAEFAKNPPGLYVDPGADRANDPRYR